jgi:hypothetical protein
MAAAMTPATLAPVTPAATTSGSAGSAATAGDVVFIGPPLPPEQAAVKSSALPQPPKYRDLWGRIRRIAMEEIDSPLVARHEAGISTAPNTCSAWSNAAGSISTT